MKKDIKFGQVGLVIVYQYSWMRKPAFHVLEEDCAFPDAYVEGYFKQCVKQGDCILFDVFSYCDQQTRRYCQAIDASYQNQPEMTANAGLCCVTEYSDFPNACYTILATTKADDESRELRIDCFQRVAHTHGDYRFMDFFDYQNAEERALSVALEQKWFDEIFSE